jgi:hypothetical protein
MRRAIFAGAMLTLMTGAAAADVLEPAVEYALYCTAAINNATQHTGLSTDIIDSMQSRRDFYMRILKAHHGQRVAAQTQEQSNDFKWHISHIINSASAETHDLLTSSGGTKSAMRYGQCINGCKVDLSTFEACMRGCTIGMNQKHLRSLECILGPDRDGQ